MPPHIAIFVRGGVVQEVGLPEESEKFFTLAWPAPSSNAVLPLDSPPLPDVWSAARLPNAT
jgi:hypothetical protein